MRFMMLIVCTFAEKIISEMFLCLTSWLTSNSNVFLTDPELATKIFQVVEFGLIGKLVRINTNYQHRVNIII